MNSTAVPRPNLVENGYSSMHQGARVVAMEVPAICQHIAESIPSRLEGGERFQFIGNELERLSDEQRDQMRQHIETIVDQMGEVDASDVAMGSPACKGYVWFRANGDNKPVNALGKFSVGDTDVLLLNLLSEKQLVELMVNCSIDFSFRALTPGGERPKRFRATMYFDNGHLALNMRAISEEVRPMKSLGFHPVIERGLLFRYVRDGLTLITGVTGSGKSSTLDAIVDANNADAACHIVVIGRPIEFVHFSKSSMVRHREVGTDVNSFKDGVVQAMRQDPDIVVIGEMRDPETISAGIEVADSGHKVFSTLHTSSAVESLDRMVAEYPPEEQERIRNRLADTLRCIISQKLCPKAGGGRVLAKEVLWMTPSAKAAIKNNNAGEIYQMIWEGTEQGMHTLEQDLVRLVRAREITPETALNFANNKRRLMQILR